jgi:hypothetical protein
VPHQASLLPPPRPPNQEDWHRARATPSRSGILASGLPVGVPHDAHIPTAAMVAIAARPSPMLSLTVAGAWADLGPMFLFFDHRSPVAGCATCSSLPVDHSSLSLRDDAGF